jgi:hypothetical protein
LSENRRNCIKYVFQTLTNLFFLTSCSVSHPHSSSCAFVTPRQVKTMLRKRSPRNSSNRHPRAAESMNLSRNSKRCERLIING